MVITLFLFEWIYRSYLIDFYRPELEALNKKELIEKEKKTILIIGDSFSASRDCYVDILRDSLPETKIINASIPGTSFLQHQLFLDKRIKEFKPEHIIIQIYVGNDLIDYDHPVNWSKLSFKRNLYWWLSDSFIGLQFINFRMGQFFSSKTLLKDPKEDNVFDPLTYNHREKIYFRSDPFCLNNSITFKGNKINVIKELAKDLENNLSELKTTCSILVIPHAAQVKKDYLKNMKVIGGKFDSNITAWHNFRFYHFLQKKLNHLKHVRVFSPLTYFQHEKTDLYFLNDPHLNKNGNQVLASYLLHELFD